MDENPLDTDPTYREIRNHNNSAIDDFYHQLMQESNTLSVSAFRNDLIDFQVRSKAEALRPPQAPVVVKQILPGEEEKFLNEFVKELSARQSQQQSYYHSNFQQMYNHHQQQQPMFHQEYPQFNQLGPDMSSFNAPYQQPTLQPTSAAQFFAASDSIERTPDVVEETIIERKEKKKSRNKHKVKDDQSNNCDNQTDMEQW
ncbi:hypothetical protein ACOME3_006038 [Neoechinorhynchus agilis]